MKIYISGKIAGDPNYKGKFARAAAQLERLGATVINPATAPEGLTKLDYMRICFAEMRHSSTTGLVLSRLHRTVSHGILLPEAIIALCLMASNTGVYVIVRHVTGVLGFGQGMRI